MSRNPMTFSKKLLPCLYEHFAQMALFCVIDYNVAWVAYEVTANIVFLV